MNLYIQYEEFRKIIYTLIEKKIKVADETNVILVGWLQQGQPEQIITEYLDELSFLAETAGAKEVKR